MLEELKIESRLTKLSNCITNACYNHTKGVGKKEL